jgi:hypothetical protein
MKSYKTTGKIVGALFLTVMVTYSIGAFVLVDPMYPSYQPRISMLMVSV